MKNTVGVTELKPQKQQQSDVQLPEGLESLGIIGAELKTPRIIVLKGLRGALIVPPLRRETHVSRTADVIFPGWTAGPFGEISAIIFF